MSQGKTQKKDDKAWIFILLLLLGLGFVFFSQNSGSEKKASSSNPMPDEARLKRVDTHMKDMAFNLEAEKRQRQIEVYQQLNKLKGSNSQNVYRENKDFSLESDPYMQSLTQELDRSRQAPQDQATPEEIVQQRLYENDQLKKASEAYREAYAEQFKENARQGGWDIEIGPNFEVLSVKKIKERNPSLFEDGDGGSSR